MDLKNIFIFLLTILSIVIALGFFAEQVQGQITCSETDGGDDPYTKGFHVGTYPWGGNTNQVPDRCRLNNNQPVRSCTNCKLMEYYCREDGYLFWNFYTEIDCDHGAIVEQDECEFTDPATTYELTDYPGLFVTGNNTFSSLMVVANVAPAEDVIAITEIFLGLDNEGYQLDPNYVMLDIQVTDHEQNMVLIGDVCENLVLQEILCYNATTCSDAYTDLGVAPDEAYIGLFESDLGDFYLVITGEDPIMRREAANVVVDHNHADFNGQYMIVQ